MKTDDPRLTAYALGELDEAGRAEVEALLATDPALGREVEAMRGTASYLTTTLARTDSPVLSPQRRGRIEKLLTPRGPAPALSKETTVPEKSVWSRHPWIPPLAVLGAVTGFLGVSLMFLGQSARLTSKSASDHAPKFSRSKASRPGGPSAGAAPRAPAAFSAARAPAPRDHEEMPSADRSGESFQSVGENPFRQARQEPLSTFSIDVDTASYSVVRSYLKQGTRPPADAVRIEEMINYFPYTYPAPDPGQPLAVHAEVASCPWAEAHRLVKIGLKGREIERSGRPASNLVFLLDVSGSMSDDNKLPLLRKALRLMVDELGENDRVAMVTYAGSSGLALPATPCDRKAEILLALENLEAGGSTNGGEGIELAYNVAIENFRSGGINRVILCTDGDFNVGMTSDSALEALITDRARTGVFLSVLGFGMGNLKDSTLERLADKGNGNYAYIDDIKEARKTLVEQIGGTLVTVAKDVKLQIEFNPAQVEEYRLIGYENRVLAARDFNDDTKDAGELGAGHTVTALYEIIPAGHAAHIDPLRYGTPSASAAPASAAPAASDELLYIKLRYKLPEATRSEKLSFPVRDTGRPYAAATAEFKFAAAVAAFGMLLRDSPHRGTTTAPSVADWIGAIPTPDPGGYRAEFLQLVEKLRQILPAH